MVLLAIHVAARDGDLVALRRELANGVSPNAPTRHHGLKPLHLLCGWQRGKSAFSTRSSGCAPVDNNPDERLACVHALVGAGADIHANDNHNAPKCRHPGWHTQWTPLHFAVVLCRVSLVAALIEAGADVNAALPNARAGGGLPLALAVGFGASARRRECIALLLRAGAAVNPSETRPLGKAWLNPSLYPILLRAGATCPIPAHPDPYLAKILKAGGFRGNGFQNYERARRNAMNAMFIPKFAHLLPPELVRRVVEFYWLHAPYY